MRYRKLIKWPILDSLTDFPLFVDLIEKALPIKFTRHVNVGPNGIDLDRWVSEHRVLIQEWVSPCADSFGAHLISQHAAEW